MLSVRWHESINPEVEVALAALPEGALCPPDVYRRLLAMKRPEPMRIALVSDGAKPVALTGLVKRDRMLWEPISNRLYPGIGFPADPARVVEALAAIGVEIPVIWSCMPTPEGPNLSAFEFIPSYRLENLAAREEYWRSTDYFRHVRNIRNRARHLEFRVGAPELAGRIVSGWREKWGGDAAEPEVAARILLAETLEPLGRHLTFALFDGDTLVAGSTNFIYEGALVAGVLYAPAEYRALGAGVRLIDAIFEEAHARGLDAFDLGGGGVYKRKWAPVNGQEVRFTVAAPHVRLMRGALTQARAAVRAARGQAPAPKPAPEPAD